MLDRPRVRHAVVAAGLLVVFFLFAGSVYAADWRQADGKIGILAPRPMDFEEWYRWDVGHVNELMAGYAADPASGGKLLASEMKEIDTEIQRIQEEEAYVHPVRKFRVYPPQVTGKLHVLFLALQSRDRLLVSGPLGGPPRPEDLYRLGDFRLYPTTTAKYPSVSQAIEALEEIRLPERFFYGYRVYLLPYSLGEIGGEGGNGYSFISAEPADTDLIDDHVFVTLTHEFGHNLQLRYLGGSYGDNPGLWDEYMKIRKIPGWRNDGEVQTRDWALSPEEAFAEDVRVLFGSRKAVADFYDSAYADPRSDRNMRQTLERFILSLGEAGPGRPPEDPWAYTRRGEYDRLKSELRHALEGTVSRWWLAAPIVATILAAAGLGLTGARFVRRGGRTV
ncbi:MAG: hypothetical protein ACM3TT_00580 [Syntrophothermus sp.]